MNHTDCIVYWFRHTKVLDNILTAISIEWKKIQIYEYLPIKKVKVYEHDLIIKK